MATPEEIEAERERRRAARQGGGQQTTAAAPSSEAIAAERWRRRQMRQAEARDRQPSPESQPDRVGAVEDVLRSGWRGLREGVAAIAGMGGDLRDINRRTNTMAAEAIGIDPRIGTVIADLGSAAIMPGSLLSPNSEQSNETLERYTGEYHEPQTTAGRYARTIGSFAPNAVLPGGLASRVTRVVVPAVASEAAGQATEGTPYETPARIGGAVIGAVGAEAGIAANARRALRQQPRPEAEVLEQEFGPLTRGERSGNTRMRLEEDDLRRGIGSDQAQATMRTFDARRAQTIRDNAMGVVTRGQPALSENIGEAGVILGDELRTARQAIRARAQAQYDRAFELAKGEPIPAGLNDTPSARVLAASEEHLFEVPSSARQTLATLERQIQEGTATQANVERARQALNRELGAASNARNDALEFAYARTIEALDDWQGSLIRSPQARRAMEEARGIYREGAQLYGRQARTELSTGQTGRMDPGGRAIDRTINTDLTGEQIIDGILGTGTRPSQQALGAVRRIRQLGTERIKYTNRAAESGVRVPGRQRVGGQTAGQRRFNADDPNAPPTQQNPRGGMEQPTPELQALREGLWHRILRPVDDYLQRAEVAGAREGGILPAQRMVSQLDHALNKGGREIMAQLYTPRELEAMQRLLRYFKTIVPPQGAAVSNTPAGIYRMITSAFDKALGIIPGLGPVLREAVIEAGSTNAARRAVRPLSARAPTRARAIEQPSPVTAPLSGAIGSQREFEDERRSGRIGLGPR